MNRFETAIRAARSAAIQSLDFSMFSTRDIANVALQRSEVLLDIPGQADALRAWARGDDGPILHIAGQHGTDLARRALACMFIEYRALRPVLRKIAPKRIADIGCGYGFFGLFAQAELGADLLLVDTETSKGRVLRYSTNGSACADLQIAARFLIANGCDPARITTLNPQQGDLLSHPGQDLAISLLACGFLFPAETYAPFFRQCVRPGGSVILDVRVRRAQNNLPVLEQLGHLNRLTHAADGKAARIHLVTHSEQARSAA